MATLLDGLIDWWTLNETSGQRDDSHGTNHLTDVNTVLAAAGKVGNGADFELSNSQYLSRALPGLLDGLTDFTIVFWAKLESAGATRGLLGQGASGSNSFVENTRVFIRRASGNQDHSFADPFSTTQFDFFVLRSTPTTISLRKNDTTTVFTSTTGALGNVTTAVTQGFRLGSCLGSSGGVEFFWDGGIDEAALYGRSISSAEETELNAGLTYTDFSGGGSSSGGKRRRRLLM